MSNLFLLNHIQNSAGGKQYKQDEISVNIPATKIINLLEYHIAGKEFCFRFHTKAKLHRGYFSNRSFANLSNNCFCPTSVKKTVALMFEPLPSTLSTFPLPNLSCSTSVPG